MVRFSNINIAFDYYPFGMLMPGRSYSSTAYKYGFQGQEKDGEVSGDGNHIDFKFRGYDPRIGRFWSVDPLVKKYPELSSYAFSGNQVIHTIELEGAEPLDYLGIGDHKGLIQSSSKNQYERNSSLSGVIDGLYLILAPVNLVDNLVTDLLDNNLTTTQKTESVLGTFDAIFQPIGIKGSNVPKVNKISSSVIKEGTQVIKGPKSQIEFKTDRAAMRQAKRDEGIPTSQTFSTKKIQDASKSGKSSRKEIEYTFSDGKTIQHHPEGHKYSDGTEWNQNHWNNHPPKSGINPSNQTGTDNHYVAPNKK